MMISEHGRFLRNFGLVAAFAAVYVLFLSMDATRIRDALFAF